MLVSQTFLYLHPVQENKWHFLKVRPFFIKDAKIMEIGYIISAQINRFGPP